MTLAEYTEAADLRDSITTLYAERAHWAEGNLEMGLGAYDHKIADCEARIATMRARIAELRANG